MSAATTLMDLELRDSKAQGHCDPGLKVWVSLFCLVACDLQVRSRTQHGTVITDIAEEPHVNSLTEQQAGVV